MEAASRLHRPAIRKLRRRARCRGDLRSGERHGMTAAIKDNRIEEFLDALASQAATPGGGGAAAIIGAMGAALVSMVCNLTIGKKKYAEVEADMKDVLGKTESVRRRVTGMIEDDAQV